MAGQPSQYPEPAQVSCESKDSLRSRTITKRAMVGKPTLDPGWLIPSAPKFVMIRPNEGGPGLARLPVWRSLFNGGQRLQFDLDYVPEGNVLRVRVWGAGGPNLVEEMVAAIRSAPEFLPGMGVLIDAFGTDYAPSTSEAKDLPAVFGSQLPGSRLALVVRGGTQYTVACLVEALASRGNVPFAVFQDRADAMQWLAGSLEGR